MNTSYRLRGLMLVLALVLLAVSDFRVSSALACFPCIKIGRWTLTPYGPAPTVVVNKVDQATAPVPHAVEKGAVSVANAVTAQPREILKVMAGQESLSAAAKDYVKSQGQAIASVASAVSTTNAVANNLTVVAAESIGGNVGKTVMTIGTGVDRLQVEFATTTAIDAGEVVQGQNVGTILSTPLAAAIRAAEKQFEPQAQPLPAAVKTAFANYYPANVLNNARWTVGSVSISLPDLIITEKKIFEDTEYAVTVGHVTVFARDPTNNLHWWAHELQHQVQYSIWHIDQFALNYVTSCHSVETDAENKAQQVVPIPNKVNLGC